MRKYLKELLEDFLQAINELAEDAAIAIYLKKYKKFERPRCPKYAVDVIDLNDF